MAIGRLTQGTGAGFGSGAAARRPGSLAARSVSRVRLRDPVAARRRQASHLGEAGEQCIRPARRADRTNGQELRRRLPGGPDPARRFPHEPARPGPGPTFRAVRPPLSGIPSDVRWRPEAGGKSRASVPPPPGLVVLRRRPCRSRSNQRRSHAAPPRRILRHAGSGDRVDLVRGSRDPSSRSGRRKGGSRSGRRRRPRCCAPRQRQLAGAITMWRFGSSPSDRVTTPSISFTAS